MESPRWLMSVEKYDECLKVLKMAAEMNKKTLPDEATLLAEIKSVKVTETSPSISFEGHSLGPLS